MNSSITSLERWNISAADISKPFYNIMSITWPSCPDFTICGLMIQREQLSRTAVVFINLSAGFPPKKKSISLAADCAESAPWVAFLVPSVPNKALREPGASDYAFWVLVGPIKLLHLSTAYDPVRLIPTTTSLYIWLLRFGKNGLPMCSP